MRFFQLLSAAVCVAVSAAAPLPQNGCGDAGDGTLSARQCGTEDITNQPINCNKPPNQWNSQEKQVCATSAQELSTRQFKVTIPNINCNKPANQWNSQEQEVCSASVAAHA